MNTDTNTPGFVKWSPVNDAYFDPYDVTLIARAKSILYAMLGQVDLTPDQARDVIAWSDTH